MSFVDQVRAKRQKLADVLADEEYSGIREIVEQLYPDRAHFIYELLQNAEDTGASDACFNLSEEGLWFEHDGHAFSQDDVWAITNIGKGAKKDQEDTIGRFGIGFKAVFAYSETPHIWSPSYSFRIADLVLPTELEPTSDLAGRTRFYFPFNNPEKPPRVAWQEVAAGLEELAETTLLFLSHLDSVAWRIGSQSSGEVLRINHSEHHIEVLKKSNGRDTTSSHYLQFSDAIAGLERQRVAIAFELGFLPEVTEYHANDPLAKQLRIVPANPGRVAVYFPAEKETSGLRFHLHAPFVPELSRASIKETANNNPLFAQLAHLAAASLPLVRDVGLLTGDFLGVLPNPQDALPARYQPIRDAIINSMNNERLTPTYAKSHAPARQLLQARAALKDLLSPDDLDVLRQHRVPRGQWAISASQRNSNADRLLSALAIQPWDIDEFMDALREASGDAGRWQGDRYFYGPDPDFQAWLAAKSEAWHQQMYALLNPESDRSSSFLHLRNKKIIRLSDGTYGIGSQSYFPTEHVEDDEELPRVARGVYTSGRSKPQQDAARRFLEQVGVREVGEAEELQAILKRRYSGEVELADWKIHLADLKRFVKLVETNPNQAEVFRHYSIIRSVTGQMQRPQRLFVDAPLRETGLAAYYEAVGEHATRVAVSSDYARSGVPLESLVRFCQATGVQTQLEVLRTSCRGNPRWDHLRTAPGVHFTTSGIDRDSTVPGLEKVLQTPTVNLSRLIWQMMCSLPKWSDCLTAHYRYNQRNPGYSADSQLACLLRDAAWVPQTGGAFVRPRDACRALLPEGFPFDTGQQWLRAVNFGVDAEKKSEEQRQKRALAEQLGFGNAKTLERAQRFAALPEQEQERLLTEYLDRQGTELPGREPRDPHGRANRVADEAAGAPGRETEQRPRAVSLARERVKQEAEQYLRHQYTNDDGEMICQVCHAHLPFKLDDGSYYVEKVEFLPELRKRHYQNYLALCPNHAAMFQHAHGSRDMMLDMFLDMSGQELDVILAQKDFKVYFTLTHLVDVRALIASDSSATEDEDDAKR